MNNNNNLFGLFLQLFSKCITMGTEDWMNESLDIIVLNKLPYHQAKNFRGREPIAYTPIYAILNKFEVNTLWQEKLFLSLHFYF